MKLTFLEKSKITKSLIIIFILWIFGFYTLMIILFLLLVLITFLFRKVPFEHTDKRTLGSNILCSPVTGKLLDIEELSNMKRLVIKTSIFNEYGVYLPGDANISDYKLDNRTPLISLEIANKFERLTLTLDPIFNYFPFESYIQSGDRGSLGASIGYLPFGGKTVIELPLDSEVLIKKGDKVKSFQTLIAKVGE